MGKQIMTSASVPVMRLGHPLAFAGFLRSIGAPIDSALQRAQLPSLCENPNAYVPVHSVHLFFEDMSHREVEALGWETGYWAQENHVHQGLIKRLSMAPTLGRALKDFSDLVSAENSHYRLRIINYGEDVLFCIQDGCGTDTPGYHIGLSYSLMVVIAIIRHFAGASWQPAEIGVEAPTVTDSAREKLPDTQIITGQKMCYIRLPRIFLSLPPESQWSIDCAVYNAKEPIRLTQQLNYSGRLRLVLESYLAEGCPPAEQLAAMIGTSSRTLRRRLINEGITYSELVDQVRFDVARQLMLDPAVKMIDIAYALGYSDPSHFTRSFRRMTGISPSEYRQQRCTTETSDQDWGLAGNGQIVEAS